MKNGYEDNPMMDQALALAKEGFWVFPLQPGSKIPAVKFKEWATRNPQTIADYWDHHPDYNIGIFTEKFNGGDEALVVVDVDNKEGRNGDAELVRLELDGKDLGPTRVHFTPSGGRHYLYSFQRPVKQGANKLGMGLDIRSRGGYVVGPGSHYKGRIYTNGGGTVGLAPQWIIADCGDDVPERPRDVRVAGGINVERANFRATLYLKSDAPLGLAGSRNDTAFKVAAYVRDLGVDMNACFCLMDTHWKCEPPLTIAELEHTVESVYRYAQNAPGTAATEADFEPVIATTESPKGNPVEELNKEFAYVQMGGGDFVLWETTGVKNQFELRHLEIPVFHRRHGLDRINVGKKTMRITEDWLDWKGRRTFDGLVFMPEQVSPPRFYNLWRGFAYHPFPHGVHAPAPALEALGNFLQHIFENVCGSNKKLNDWLIGYFAHLVQKPWEKPLVALVFKGGKGVGKNVAVETVGALLGPHFLLASNRRYLVGNFNSHLENCLLFALDEAFWSGDKQAEGVLKDLITGKTHVIEYKGKEHYTVDNRTRVAIIGNEEWLIPASNDERRFAVFEVGDARKQDTKFFTAMREGMEQGGYRLLLRYLLDHNLKEINVNEAPQTKALMDQKHSTLEPVHQWWLDSLTEGRIVGCDFTDGWPKELACDRFRMGLRRYLQDRGIRSRVPDDRAIGRQVKNACPRMEHFRIASGYAYKFPNLATCRDLWDTYIGHPVGWLQ